MRAWLVNDDLVECEVKSVMSIPASYPPAVLLFTASCGALKLTKNCFGVLIISVFFK